MSAGHICSPVSTSFTLSFLTPFFKLQKFSCHQFTYSSYLLTQQPSFPWISSATCSFSISTSALPSVIPLSWGCWSIQLQPDEGESLGPLFRHGQRWGRRFSRVFGWSRVIIVQLNAICLPRLPLSPSYLLEQAFVGTYFVGACWLFHIASFFTSKSGINEVKRKPGKLTTVS